MAEGREGRPVSQPDEPEADRAGGAADSAPKQGKQPTNRLSDLLTLEAIFPDPFGALAPHKTGPLAIGAMDVALDANALLLPYEVTSASLEAITATYDTLAGKKRLVVPGRALREFLANRNECLVRLVKALNLKRSHLARLPPLLASLPQYKEGDDALKKAKEALDKIIEQVKAWRGDDPVTAMYLRLFTPGVVIDLPQDKASREALVIEHLGRLANRVPPGYKDGGKPDAGIGDFLIWKTLLQVGKSKKCDLAFVTGEKKPDWFSSRADNEPVYPRHELVDEYRRASDNHSLTLMTLHQLLEEMKAPKEAVKDVKSAEERREFWTEAQRLQDAIANSIRGPGNAGVPAGPGVYGGPAGPSGYGVPIGPGGGYGGPTGRGSYAGPTGPSGYGSPTGLGGYGGPGMPMYAPPGSGDFFVYDTGVVASPAVSDDPDATNDTPEEPTARSDD